MRAAVITRQGDPVAPNVEIDAAHPDPEVGPGEVLVRTEASALNHLDLWVGRGVPGLDLAYPRISGSDGCGIVESAGEGVDRSWIGRRVILNAAVVETDPPHPDRPHRPVNDVAPRFRVIGEHVNGTMAERFAAPATNLVALDDCVDPLEAAAFGLTHLTAWSMLVTKARLVPGQSVLVTGIGGGVALAALNICRHFGCRVIVTSRDRAKLDRALELGAAHAVLDTGDDWSSQVRACSGDHGVDVCVDSIGAAVHESCERALAPGGTFVTCGCTTGPKAPLHLARLFWFQLRFIGSTMGSMDEFRQAVAVFATGGMRPVIDSVFDADEVAGAYRHLESGAQFGKVVVRWS